MATGNRRNSKGCHFCGLVLGEWEEGSTGDYAAISLYHSEVWELPDELRKTSTKRRNRALNIPTGVSIPIEGDRIHPAIVILVHLELRTSKSL